MIRSVCIRGFGFYNTFMSSTEQVQLLCDGTEAFPLIFEEIRRARTSIYINMFIWRGDEIGHAIAAELLDAADRGVKITIVKDRYGIVCEYCEEDQTSFFYQKPAPLELVSIRTLEAMYNPDLFGKEQLRKANDLREAILRHPNITVSCEKSRHDHSKFYLFDEEILILGGMNIEDKELKPDRAGRTYRDFMIRFQGREYVRLFRERRSGITKPESECFSLNVKEAGISELLVSYLNLILHAEAELTILMAYFSPVPEIVRELKQALARGVAMRILIPNRANFMSDISRKTMLELYRYAKESGGNLKVYLSDDMTHTKLLMSEKEISVGSCNITANAFTDLDEANYRQANDDSPFARRARKRAKELISAAREVQREEELSFRKWMAMLEETTM